MENEENKNLPASKAPEEGPEFADLIPVEGRNGGTLYTFPPGTSGNKNGRPKGSRSLIAIMKKLLDEKVLLDAGDGKTIQLTRREALMLQKLDLAMNSPFDAVKLSAIKDIEDRLDGRPLPQLPAGEDSDGEQYHIFYIPNAHSRKRTDYDAED